MRGRRFVGRPRRGEGDGFFPGAQDVRFGFRPFVEMEESSEPTGTVHQEIKEPANREDAGTVTNRSPNASPGKRRLASNSISCFIASQI